VGRAISFLAGLIAVIAGLGSGLAWLNGHTLPQLVFTVATVLITFPLALILINEYRVKTRTGYGIGILAGSIFGAVGPAAAHSEAVYVYVAVGAFPMCWLHYQYDKQQHKKCPDCCETVKSEARVCRYCLYEFRPR
jgi:hypothetical protein